MLLPIFFFYVDMVMQSLSFHLLEDIVKNMSNYSVENAMSRGFSEYRT